MRTADEIQQYVERADRERIQTRADRATRVAEAVSALDGLRQQVVEAERGLAEAIGSAKAVMSPKELADFIGAKPADIDAWASGTKSRPKTRRTRRSASAESAAPESSAAGSEGGDAAAAATTASSPGV